MADTNNLDMLATQFAQKMVFNLIPKELKEKEAEKKAVALDNLTTKCLGVLQEQGVYAAILFLYSRTSDSDKKAAEVIRQQLLELATSQLKSTADAPFDKAQTALKFVTDHIAGNLDTLLLIKQVWEQTLIYARYGAKAAAKEND